MDVQEMNADRLDERDLRALIEDEPFAIVLPLSLGAYASLRLAELIALENARIRLILASATRAPDHLLEELFDCRLPPRGEGLIEALKSKTWVHAFERRKNSLDIALQQVLETAHCFWLSGSRHMESFASLVDYQRSISSASRHLNVLLLAADPADLARLRLVNEFSVIEAELSKRADFSFTLKHVFSSRPDELARRLLEEKPHVVHFSGHGASDGRLCFEGPDGKSWPADTVAIAQIFGLVGRYVKCVVLSSCFSGDLARMIGEHIEYVIGLDSAIPDDAALSMSRGFYAALSVTGRVSSAVEAARANLRLVAGDSVKLHCETPMRSVQRLLKQSETRRILVDMAECLAEHVRLGHAFRAIGDHVNAAHHLRLAASLARSDEMEEYAIRFEEEAAKLTG